MNILMIYPKYPEETFWNADRSVKAILHRRANIPPAGLLTIASYLPADFRARLIDRNVREESDSDWQWADVVFLSLMAVQRADYDACVSAARRHRKPIAVGGPFTHAFPEIVTADADWVCFGEAESIMDELVSDLRADRRGKRYRGGHDTDMQAAKTPRFDLLPDVNAYSSMTVQFSRGCPFKCEFCDIIEIYGRIPRTKSARQVLAELDALRKLRFRGWVFLVDDNFIGNKAKARVLLQEMAGWNRDNDYPFRFYTEASINLADDPALLEAMSKASFLHVFIGIETPDPKLLKTTQKMQNTPGDPLAKLQRIRQHGVHVSAGFIVGFDGEDRGVFEAQRSFIQASGIGVAMVSLLQAIPHTQLARRLEKEKRLLDIPDLKLNQTIDGLNFAPKGTLTRGEYLEGYRWLLKEVYEPRAFFDRILPALLSLRRRLPWRAVYRVWRNFLPPVFFEFYLLGVRDRETRYFFWRNLWRLLSRNPWAVEAFLFDCFYFYHLRRHVEYVRSELERSSPASNDVLDRDATPLRSEDALELPPAAEARKPISP